MRHIFLYILISIFTIGSASFAEAKTTKSKAKAVAAAPVKKLSNYEEAVEAYQAYDFDAAAKKLEAAEEELKRKKKEVPEEYELFRNRILMGKNMLERVEKIIILDSLLVDKEDFFKFYQLTYDAGKLMPNSVLPPAFPSAGATVVFEPQSNREVFWGVESTEGNTELVSSQILDDGAFEQPEPINNTLGEGGDADYVYFMPDGVTFYFANNGENSLGGYDIFMSRRQPDGTVLQPQNVGMPYNSPFDDYMLVIDELANLGWWATDRNQIPDKITIYQFIPNLVRENYRASDPNIRDFARIASYKATQDGNLLAMNDFFTNAEEVEKPEFYVSLAGKIYTNYSQLRNVESETAMRQYQDRLKDYQLMQGQLRVLRDRYREGDKTVANDIKSLEKRLLSGAQMLPKLRNQAVLAETKK